jgi:hypothetical protein
MLDLNLTSLSFENYLLQPARAPVDDAQFERVSRHEAARAVALALHDAGLRRALLRLWGDAHPPSAAAGTGANDVLAERWMTAMLTRPGAPLLLLRRRLPRITGHLALQGALPPQAPPEPKRDEAIWLEFEVLYDDESGAAGSRYRVEGPSASAGRLDKFGYAYQNPVDPGSYRAIFDDAPPEPPIDPGWLVIEVVDSSGAPRAGVAYQVKLSNGQTRNGVLDPNGRLLLAGVPEGSHEITFPKVDASSIEPQE